MEDAFPLVAGQPYLHADIGVMRALTEATTRQKAGKSLCFVWADERPGGTSSALVITVSGSLSLRKSSQLAACEGDTKANRNAPAVIANTLRLFSPMTIPGLSVWRCDPLRIYNLHGINFGVSNVVDEAQVQPFLKREHV